MKKSNRQLMTIGAVAGAGVLGYLLLTNWQAMRRQANRAATQGAGYLGYELPTGLTDWLSPPTAHGLPAFGHYSQTERDIAQHAVDVVGWLQGLQDLTTPRETVVQSTPAPGSLFGVRHRFAL